MKNNEPINIKFTSDSNGNRTNYPNLSQNDVIDLLNKNIKEDVLVGSSVITGPNTKLYSFTLKDKDKHKQDGTIRIKIDSRISPKGDISVSALDSISTSLGKVKKANRIRVAALVLAGTVLVQSYGPNLAKGLSNVLSNIGERIVQMDNEAYEKETQFGRDYVSSLNYEREKNGSRPLEVSREEWEIQQRENAKALEMAKMEDPDYRFEREMTNYINEMQQEENNSKGMR